MTPSRERVLNCLEDSIRRLMAFRGIETDKEVSEVTNPIDDLGLKSGDLVNVAPDIEAEDEALSVPIEVVDWADDSSGKRRYRRLGEVADLIISYLAKQETASRE